MNPEALILRRCYPVPVTFADLRAARVVLNNPYGCKSYCRCDLAVTLWVAALKQATSALDEVYAVVDGREVRVATANPHGEQLHWLVDGAPVIAAYDLLDKADRAGYWEHPHEVRLDLSPRPVSHNEVAKAVLVGQEYVERHAVK